MQTMECTTGPAMGLQGQGHVHAVDCPPFGAMAMQPMPTLDGFGASQAELEAIADQLRARTLLSTNDIADAMRGLSSADQQRLAAILLVKGTSLTLVEGALANLVPIRERFSPGVQLAFGLLATASMAASAYHGYKRNRSIGWAFVWGFFGGVFPVITPVIAVAQGFGKRK